VPLALWWQIKNFICFDTPLTYVPALSVNSDQYIGHYSFFQRLFTGFSDTVFVQWQYKGAGVNEYNPLIALLKTSMFGEFTLFDSTDFLGQGFCVLLFGIHLLLVGFSVYAGVRCMVRHRKSPVAWAFVVIWLTVMVSYLQFCFAYPQVCTQNFRYAVPTLLCGAVAIGVYAQNGSPRLRRVLCFVTMLFCWASAGCFILLGMK
jgi:hypothetical protein